MAESKRYYWLKLKDDFFDEKYIKALRRLPQGDSLVIVYLKMQLKSLKTEGIIKYEGILPDCIEELAMVLDEDENIVKLAVEALIRFGAVERWENDTLYMSALQNLIGSETQGAERVRRHRALKAQERKALQCNGNVTECNIDIDIEKDKDIEIRGKRESTKKTASRFTPPTLDDVKAYCLERGNNVDAQRFIDYYTANGWKVGRNSMKDWKAAVRTWERSDENKPAPRRNQSDGSEYADLT
ncbi:MAG: phage replisome organizer N-terminal domain-containing protein [Candidatus Coproplasma sp.]